MKILIIGTPKSGTEKLMNGISKQGYEYLDNPFKIKDNQNNWFEIVKNFKTDKFVVKCITGHKPNDIPSYIPFVSQFVSQFYKVILIDKIQDSDKFKRHKEAIKKISKMINTPIIFYENLFSKDTLEQFEVVNTLGLDLDSFELQSYLDPNNKNESVL